MATIQLNLGLAWETLPLAESRAMIDQTELLNHVILMRSEWREATGGDLTKVTANLDLLFDDILNLITGEFHHA